MNSELELKSVLENLLNCRVSLEKRIGGGRNSRVYKVVTEDLKQYVAKLYYYNAADNRKRMDTEFYSLKYLWDNGVRCIPQPLFIDIDKQCALYEFIPGEKIFCNEIRNSDIDQATHFLIHLNKLSNKRNGDVFYPASEACFSVKAIIENIRYRLQKLLSIPSETYLCNELQYFLCNIFIPAFAEISHWCESKLTDIGITPERELTEEEKTFSPSDFGYHNALRLPDKRIIFLDFEYFGLDDPAKMICDFVLHPHPAMQFPKEFKQRYVDNLLGYFKNDLRLKKRVEIVYPLFGLKWCMILLNEFVPEFLCRRDFASTEETEQPKKMTGQLRKAEAIFDNIRETYGSFPYTN